MRNANVGPTVLTRQNGGLPVRCERCKAAKEREYRHQYYERYHKKKHGDGYHYSVVYDPLPIEAGGFRKGAIISIEENKQTLRRGNYAPGTLLKYGRKLLKVKGATGQPQELISVMEA